MDAPDCLGRAMELAGSTGKKFLGLKNWAFVFIKPHAVTDKVKDLAAKKFAECGITVDEEGDLTAK